MILCIDSGNSRIKWGVHGAGRWLDGGIIEHAETDQLASLTSRLPPATRIMLANVAGDAALPLAGGATLRIVARIDGPRPRRAA